MPDQLQLRGGTTAQNDAFTGAAREVTVDTTKNTLIVHNNVDAGGAPLLREDGANSELILGSAATPSLKFTGDTNTGIFSPGADQVAVSTGGTERVEFGASEVVFNDGGANYDFRIEGDTNTALFFVDASADAVGIGTTSPSDNLHLFDSDYCGLDIQSGRTTASDNIGGLGFRNSSGSHVALIQSDVSGTIKFRNTTGTNERMRIDTAGRLLVGTSSSPSAGDGQFGLLVVSGHTLGAACYASFQREEPATSITNGETIAWLNFGDQAGNSFANIKCIADADAGSGDYPGRLAFSTTADGASSPTERMRIDSLGQVQVFTADVSGAACFEAGQDGGSGSTRLLYSGRYNATATGTGTQSFRVESSGDVKNTNNSYGAISDIKLKENIVDANSQWNDIKALQVRNYNFKEGQTHTQIGLVAQEVELVSPGLVSEFPDLDENNNDLGTVTKSVNYSVLYMKAVKALQEAMERIETLEAKVSALEAN